MRPITAVRAGGSGGSHAPTNGRPWGPLSPIRILESRRSNVMNAAVLEAIGSPLAIREVPTPNPTSREILVRIEASGVCNADVYAAAGKYPRATTPVVPRIPAHRRGG